MSAKIIELHPGMKRLPPDPDSRGERLKDAAWNVWFAVEEPVRGWLYKSPVVLIRRKRLIAREKAAFHLGRDSMRIANRY